MNVLDNNFQNDIYPRNQENLKDLYLQQKNDNKPGLFPCILTEKNSSDQTDAVRENRVSRHNGSPIKLPIKPLNTIVSDGPRGFRDPLNRAPTMPQHASLPDSSASDAAARAQIKAKNSARKSSSIICKDTNAVINVRCVRRSVPAAKQCRSDV